MIAEPADSPALARTGLERVRVVIAPEEPRDGRFPGAPGVGASAAADDARTGVPWLPELHELVLAELARIRGA